LGGTVKYRARKCETGDGEASWDRTEMEIDNAIPSPRVAPRYYASRIQAVFFGSGSPGATIFRDRLAWRMAFGGAWCTEEY